MDKRNVEKSKIKRTLRTLILASPIILLYSTLILGGMLLVFVESLGYIPSLDLTQVSIKGYMDIFSETRFLKSLVFSVFLAGVAAVFSIVAGLSIVRRLLYIKTRLKIKLWEGFLRLMIILPYLYVVLIAVLSISRTGYLSRILYFMGVIDDSIKFPGLVYDKFGIGIFFVFVLKGIPFVALFVFNMMKNLPTDYVDIGYSLGADFGEVFRRIHRPLAFTTISWCASILFAFFLGSLEVPYLIGSLSNPTLSANLYSLYLSPQISDIPKAMAMNIILFLVGIVGIFILNLGLKRWIGGQKHAKES